MFMPLSAREGNFFLVLSKGVFSFWVTAKGFSIVPQFFFGLPGTRVSRLIVF